MTKSCADSGAPSRRKLTHKNINIRSVDLTTVAINRPVNVPAVLSGYTTLSQPTTIPV
ncbi:uncharacterized protein PHACADRAFT_246418 [Phanerochaete carnosa HHB-10118-sp]|uniref:Uncharacterized protein n=1 Tax=Phanerochaete carnosa (strain HHB-10118-sp) TaxID=650164 RepID=K5WM04_PHACS|nr:uncharacterized protein PHACADRAFT_246418 [Phanerochaete carnosa HHB-10118-sp]EKM60460.1 hypothetical protein PHACADRAFT_246418 [Phanerochaete carnosa HHB-10118-sp]